MKLLFDQNLSDKLKHLLNKEFPDSIHVKDICLDTSEDSALWRYAITHKCTILSKDSDFYQRSLMEGPPPKIIWIRLGNCTTKQIADLLRFHYQNIIRFIENETESFLILQ